jgi:trimeric autotransporter adhesin
VKHSCTRISILISAYAAVALPASAQQPPDVVTSDGHWNTAMGTDALLSSTGSSYNNTAAGSQALYFNTSGQSNTAVGVQALYANTSGSENTAVGIDALFANVSGIRNTGIGLSALTNNTTGGYNTAIGWDTLPLNLTGNNNTASGANSLVLNSTGDNNTASGASALYSNSVGSNNTAAGYNALNSNQANDNTAIGVNALYRNTTGAFNTASGTNALYSNSVGSLNIAVGLNAGFEILGSNNIDIGNRGTYGDYGIIRIGTPTNQAAVYLAGINSVQVTGSAVYVTSNGQLGVLASSERYKTGIAWMSVDPEKLQQLRPVTFHLKTEPKGAVQYGLIAEEVNTVYPELVVRDETGRIQGVRYEELTPMLLSEVQRQHVELQQQAVLLQDALRQVAELRQLNQSMLAAISKLQTKDERVAMR